MIISHVATRSGAPVLLLHLMRLLKEKGYKFNTLIAAGNGPLFAEFEGLSDKCSKYVVPKQSSLHNKIKRRITGKKRQFNLKPFLKDIDFVLSNTLSNGHIIELIRESYDGPVISYVHELQSVASVCTSTHFLKIGLQLSDRILVPSFAVKDFLHKEYNVMEEKIGMLNYYIPSFNEINEQNVETFKLKHSLDKSFVVGALGNVEWRKGPDIFLLVAAEVLRQESKADIKFVWMGGKEESVEFQQMKFDIEKLGLLNKVIVAGENANVSLFMKSINVLLLTSREDPYPVVVLEAASEKIPAICFDESGGAPEFVGDDAGFIIDYLNIVRMAEAITYFYKNNNALKEKGAFAYEKYIKKHADKNLICQQLFNKI